MLDTRNFCAPGMTAPAPNTRLRDIGPKPHLASACDLDIECPITVELFDEPVICKDDGHTYEKAALTEWVLTRPEPTSPLTRAKLTKAIAWKSRRHTPPDYFVPNIEMRIRVKAYLDEQETFAARLAAWEKAQAQLGEDAAYLAAISAWQAESVAATAPSAPPFSLMHAVTPASTHPWMQADAAPFGRIAWPRSRQKQTADEYGKRAENAYRVGDLPESFRWWGKAIQRAPEDTAKVLRLVRIFTSEGRINEALMWLHFGMCEQPNNLELAYEFGQLLLSHAARLPNATDDDAGFYLERALQLHRTRHESNRPHSCMLLARFCASVGDYHLRVGNADVAHSLFVEANDNHFGYAPYMQRLGRSWLHKARQHGVTHTDTPELREALRLLGEARTMLRNECDDPRRASSLAKQALAACSYSFGEAHLLEADDKAAVDCLREAVALHPQEGAYHGALGDALRNRGDTEAARSAYFKAASLDSKCGRYEYEVSCIAFAASHWDLAVRTAEAAVRKSPQNRLFAAQVATLRAYVRDGA